MLKTFECLEICKFFRVRRVFPVDKRALSSHITECGMDFRD